jgi:hypothetical protein
MSRAVPLVALLAGLLCAAAGPPPKMCGDDRKMNDHPIDGYDFATTSWVRAEANAHIYRTCVENRKQPKSVWIDWRIPGPRTYVIPNDSAVGERPFPNRSTKGVLSCLIYGSYRKAIKEQYLGHEDDLPRAAQEGNCDALQHSSGPGGPPSSSDDKAAGGPTKTADASTDQPWVTIEGRAGIPSDLEDVEATMIRFVYQASIAPEGDGYSIILAYEAGGASPEFKGNIRDLTIRPGREIQELALRSSAREPIRLKELSDTIKIPMPQPKFFVLSTDSYFFLDRSGRLATEIQVPILRPVIPPT